MPDVATERLPAELGWAVGEYFRSLADQSPLIAVIDDLQWAEPAAIAIVRDLVDATLDAPFVLLVIARPELLERQQGWGAARPMPRPSPSSHSARMRPASSSAACSMLTTCPSSCARRSWARSGGNPLFCEEFVRMLIDDGRIVRTGDRWRGASANSFDVRVPESIQALLAARIDGLGSELKLVAQTASVVGEQFEADQLSQLLGRPADAALQALVHSGFVLPDRSAGSRSYRFQASPHPRCGLCQRAQGGAGQVARSVLASRWRPRPVIVTLNSWRSLPTTRNRPSASHSSCGRVARPLR
jgi:hypothetical protein